MADLYDDLATVASDLLYDLGQSITFTRKNAGTINPITGEGTTGSNTTFALNAVAVNYEKRLVDGVNILSDDLRVFAESGIEVKTNDIATISGKDYTVISVSKVSPAGTVVLYELQVRY